MKVINKNVTRTIAITIVALSLMLYVSVPVDAAFLQEYPAMTDTNYYISPPFKSTQDTVIDYIVHAKYLNYENPDTFVSVHLQGLDSTSQWRDVYVSQRVLNYDQADKFYARIRNNDYFKYRVLITATNRVHIEGSVGFYN